MARGRTAIQTRILARADQFLAVQRDRQHLANAVFNRESVAQAQVRQDIAERRRTTVVTWLTSGWLLLLTWWVSSNFARLRIARALVAREAVNRGRPITDADRLSDFPLLEAEFEALGLSTQADVYWVFALAAFTAVGLMIALATIFATRTRLPLAIMGTAWTATVALAFANGDTLSLLGSLTN